MRTERGQDFGVVALYLQLITGRPVREKVCSSYTSQTRQLAANMMREAGQLGVSYRVTLEWRLQVAEQVGEHKTSMLQDLDAGRPLELEAIVGTVLEISRLVGVPAPTIEGVYGLTRLLDPISAA